MPGGKTRTIHYISAVSGLAAIYITDEAEINKNGLYYTHTDYQGNLLALTNTSGLVVERYTGVYPDE